MENFLPDIKTFFTEAAAGFFLKLGEAVALVIVGLLLIRGLRRLMEKTRPASKLDPGVRTFLTSFVNIALKVLLFFAAAILLGVPASSLIAILGSAGLALGLALQGSLANLAGGMMLLIFKPFKVGDYIKSANGEEGYVQDITILYTRLVARNNRVIVLPNGALANSNMENYSTKGMLCQDIPVAVAYHSDLAQVQSVLLKALLENEKVKKEPMPSVLLSGMEDSALVFVLRAWSAPEDYWILPCELNLSVKKALDAAGISIPFPQLDVHLDSSR